MTSDSNGRQGTQALFESRVDKNKSFDRAIEEKPRILLDEIKLPTMARREIEVALLYQVLLYPAQYLRRIIIAKLRHKNTNRIGLALAKRTSIEAGSVVEFGCRLDHALARLLRNGTDSGGVVKHERNCGRREVEILAESPQTDGLSGLRRCPRGRSL